MNQALYFTDGNLAIDPQITEKLRSRLQNRSTVEPKKESARKGKSCEVYPFEISEIKPMMDKFAEKDRWTHYLLFVIGINMARRCGDSLKLRWRNIFDPATGNFREDMETIKEEKTDKYSRPHINKAVREAVTLYCEKTGCNPSDDNYNRFIFVQLHGTHKGNVLTEDGYLKALKKTAAEIGITRNIGTHSTRKTFGKITMMLHPGDDSAKSLLQEIYNHSDEKTTNRYIGLTKEKADQFYNDMGDFFCDYVTGDKKYIKKDENPRVILDSNDLRDIIRMALEMDNTIENFNEILNLVDGMRK